MTGSKQLCVIYPQIRNEAAAEEHNHSVVQVGWNYGISTGTGKSLQTLHFSEVGLQVGRSTPSLSDLLILVSSTRSGQVTGRAWDG